MKTYAPFTLALFASLLTACDVEPDAIDSLDPIDEDIEFRCTFCGDGRDTVAHNTQVLEGVAVNALDTTGFHHDNWSWVGTTLHLDHNSISLTEVYAEDSVLYGLDANGTLYSGAQFVGSEWNLLVAHGTFEDSEQLAAQAQAWVMTIDSFIDDGDRSRYVFKNGPSLQSTVNYNCAADSEGDRSAILFADLDVDHTNGNHVDRADTIYFGCVAGAVGKAGKWGYTPHGLSRQWHQTATRMIRADYCGDGTSWTQDNTPIQLEDILGINTFDAPGNETEAIWTPNGAACVQASRVGQGAKDINCGGTKPPCGATDTSNWTDALIWTKTMIP